MPDDGQNFTNAQPQTAPNDATGWANATSYGGNMQGANQATQRFQGLGAAAAGRQAYQQNYGGYQSLMDQANNSGRGGQADALALQRSAALGQQPSQAQLLGQNMIDQSLAAQASGAASARGGSLAQAAAMQRAANGADAYRQQGTNALMAQRAAEMADARGQYMQGATAMRSGDFQGAGIELGRDAQQIQNEQFQRGLNQQGQMGYEQMGQNAQTAQMQSQGQQAALASQNWQQQTNLDQHRTDSDTGLIGAGISAAGSVLGFLSDVRGKQDVVPLDSAPGTADYMHAMGGGPQLNGTGAPAQAPSSSFGQYLGGAFRAAFPNGAQMPHQGPSQAPAQGGFFGSDPMMKQNITQPGGTTQLGGGGMDVMGSLKANSDFATSFMKQGGHQAGGMMLSDAAAKQKAYALGRAHEHYGEPWSYERPADIVDDHATPGVGVVPEGAVRDPSRPESGPAIASPMAQANRALAPSEYEYRPQYTPPDQAPGEKNVGPMAQNMAANPVAATAVKQDPGTGMLAIDRDKALKLAMGGVGSLQQQVDSLAQAIAKKKGAAK